MRKGRFAQGPTCEPCFQRETAEGTFKHLGIENPRHIKWREQIDAFNKMAKQGKSLVEIAAQMGANPSSLSSLITRRARKLGVKRASTRKRGPSKEKMLKDKPVAKPYNEHGGGKWGVTGCWCKPCAARREASRAEANRARTIRRREAREKRDSEMPS